MENYMENPNIKKEFRDEAMGKLDGGRITELDVAQFNKSLNAGSWVFVKRDTSGSKDNSMFIPGTRIKWDELSKCRRSAGANPESI